MSIIINEDWIRCRVKLKHDNLGSFNRIIIFNLILFSKF